MSPRKSPIDRYPGNWADVANFAAMLADRHGMRDFALRAALSPAKEPDRG